MSEIKTKYYQVCDFCHKEAETGKEGMHCIKLPGYLVSKDGEKIRQCIEGCICNDCEKRLCDKIKSFLDVKEIKYAGTAIQWKDDTING